MGRFSKLEREQARQRPEGAAQPAAVAVAEAPVDYPTAIQRADDHFFRGEFEKALRFYSRALQTESNRQYPWIGQISCLLEMGQVQEADLWVQRGLELFPEDPALLSLRAVVMARRGMAKRAIGTSDYSMTRGATVFSWIARGEVLLLSENRNATFAFGKAMEAAPPDDWQTPFRIGRICFQHGVWPTALEYFQRAASRRPANHWLWYHLGICYMRMSFKQEAIDALRQAMTLEPDFPAGHDALRRAYRQSLWSRVWGFFRR